LAKSIRPLYWTRALSAVNNFKESTEFRAVAENVIPASTKNKNRDRFMSLCFKSSKHVCRSNKRCKNGDKARHHNTQNNERVTNRVHSLVQRLIKRLVPESLNI